MSMVTYIATRSIMTGHVLDGPYELEFCLVAADPVKTVNRVDQVALSGRRESLFWNHRDGYTLTIGHFTEVSTENDAVVEFLDSVIGGEPFEIDLWGTVGDPDNPQTAVMTSAYAASRFMHKPGAKTDLLTYSFPIEIIPNET
jgi:hypothetical protein